MRAMFRKMDKVLLFLMIAFTIAGLIMIFSASSITAVLYNGLPEYYYFQKELMVVCATWVLGIIVLNMPTQRYRFFAPMGMVAIMALLIAIFSYGTITNSARRWFDLGFFSLQPSEFAKSIIIVYLGVYFERIIKKKAVTLNNVIMPFIIIGGMCFLTMLQPDLGTAIIVGAIAFFIFLALPIDSKEIKYLKLAGIATAIIGVFIMILGGNFLNAEQLSRLNYKDPCDRYTEKTGYQVCNGLIAISNGGLFGQGLGNSTQKHLYLPEAHTDFIFPVIIEELGAVGGLVIIICFIVLLYRILTISRNAANLRGSIIAYGTFIYILLHLLINFMGVLALIPLTGISVPFLSYGGSFYINILFMLFLVQRIKIEAEVKKKQRVLGDYNDK